MSADGFSVKTSIAQMGNVARTQLKGQQNPVANQQVKRPGEEQSRVEQVRKTEESQKSKLDPDADREKPTQSSADGEEHERDEDRHEHDEDAPATPGRVLDLKA